jgi:hypothetical protein
VISSFHTGWTQSGRLEFSGADPVVSNKSGVFQPRIELKLIALQGATLMSGKLRNVFVSHHHKDDASVDGLTGILAGKNYNIRNSSIRVKPENQKRLDQNKISDNTIKRLLRMKMSWASKVIVVIGKETHSRPWVNWEIKEAHRLGKPIVGVFENGLKDQVELPENLMKYASSRVGWRSDSIIDALEGKSQFENPDGTISPKIDGQNIVC